MHLHGHLYDRDGRDPDQRNGRDDEINGKACKKGTVKLADKTIKYA